MEKPMHSLLHLFALFYSLLICLSTSTAKLCDSIQRIKRSSSEYRKPWATQPLWHPLGTWLQIAARSPNLHGPFPHTLTKLKLLRNLRVSYTNLNGSIPSFLGKTTLNSLNLLYNHLTGPIPSTLGNLHNLYDLDLSVNRLTGSIPATFNSSNLPNPFGLHLALNNLSGPIPQSVGTVNLTFIELAVNNFTRDATLLFGKEKTGLTFVSLRDNSFLFDFSKVVIPNNLVDLDISNNQIFGSLPQSIILPPFDEFNVSYNKLCGRIPTSGFLQEFDASAFMDNRCLCGNPLPPCT
ncbi:Polygalacturonase inhibitor-like protein [Drosera capensis]